MSYNEMHFSVSVESFDFLSPVATLLFPFSPEQRLCSAQLYVEICELEGCVFLYV